MSDELTTALEVQARGTDLAELFAAAHELRDLQVHPIDVDGRAVEHVVVTAAGFNAHRITIDPTVHDHLAERPRSRRGTVRVMTASALIDYATALDWDLVTSRLYYRPDEMTAELVFDDHGGLDKPGWRRDRCRLELDPTPAWLRWNGANGRALDQVPFAELVEDGLADIVDPPGTDLLEIAQTMSGHTGAQWRASQRLNDGRIQMSYVEQVEAQAGTDGTLQVPTAIRLRLAPFRGADKVDVSARFRYRINGSKLTITIIIDNLEDLLTAAVEAEVAKIADALTLPAIPVHAYPSALG